MKAFVLCKLQPGTEQKSLHDIRDIEGIMDVYVVFGGWDLILSCEADTLDKLSELVVARLRNVKGVSATETLVTTHI